MAELESTPVLSDQPVNTVKIEYICALFFIIIIMIVCFNLEKCVDISKI